MGKLVYLVADGMGGYPLPALHNRTTLEAATTPHIDFLARKGRCGRCQTIPAGKDPGSDVGNMSLLGYDPCRYHTGRGPMEAAAMTLHTRATDLLWRVNFVQISAFDAQGIMQDYNAAQGKNTVLAPWLANLQTLARKYGLELLPGKNAHHILIQKKGAKTTRVSPKIRPPHDILGCGIAADFAQFAQNPPLMDFLCQAHESLKKARLPGNALWPWGQGPTLHLPDFFTTTGLRGALMTNSDVLRGLGRAAGLATPKIFPNTPSKQYEQKVRAALQFLQSGDFVYIHAEAPDVYGHQKNAVLKRRAIERFDRELVAPIVQALQRSTSSILVTCDHYTPVATGTHTKDPVPFALFHTQNPYPARQNAFFSERHAQDGDLFFSSGPALFAYALRCAQLSFPKNFP